MRLDAQAGAVSVGAVAQEGDGAERAADRGQYMAGARAFMEWGQALPDGVAFGTMDEALEAFGRHLDGERLERVPTGQVVRVPSGWRAIPVEPDQEMLDRFQSGFMGELRKKKGRKQTAEQAGLKAMLKRLPALPVGWTY